MRRLLASLAVLLVCGAWIVQVPSGGGGGGGNNIASDSQSNGANNGGSGNLSFSYTDGSGSNRLLVACVAGSTGSDSSPVATYNSVSMTLATSAKTTGTGGRWNYLFYLLAPATGANTFAVTQTGGDYLIAELGSYTGVLQSSQPDATATGDSATANVTSLTTNITVGTSNSWVVSCGQSGNITSWTNGSNTFMRAHDGSFANGAIYDTNGPLSAGTVGINITGTNSAPIGQVMASFKSF